MMNANDHYERLFGEFGLSPQDAARWVFASGWNAALDELMRRMGTMPLRDDLRGMFATYIATLIHIDGGDKDKMQ